jgi:hypothetical protein
MEQLEQSLAASHQAQDDGIEKMQGLRVAFAVCEENAAAVAAQSQRLAHELNRLNTEVASRKTRHRLKFAALPPPSFLCRLKQAANILFPAATG